MTIIGIDLAGSPEYGARRYNRLGLAALTDNLSVTVLTGYLRDDAILAFAREHRGALIAIDSPLSLPAGRCCADPVCACAQYGIVRAADREMAARGLHPFWTLLPSMRPLTLRGIALKRQFEESGLQVIEVFPGAAQDVLGLPRKQRGPEALQRGLQEHLAINGVIPADDGDALDAVTAAYVGWLHLRGETIGIGPPDEVQVIVPRFHLSLSGRE